MKNFIASVALASLVSCQSSPVYAKTSSSLCQQNIRDRIAIIIRCEGGKSTQWKLALCQGKTEQFSSPVTTGKPQKDGRGVWTPEWHFSVGQMQKHRVSASYNKAPMPNSLHVTRGIFIHEGKVGPEYASRGCIRLPNGKSEQLYQMVSEYKSQKNKVHVIITNTNPHQNFHNQ